MPKGIPRNGINKGWFKKGCSSNNKSGKRIFLRVSNKIEKKIKFILFKIKIPSIYCKCNCGEKIKLLPQHINGNLPKYISHHFGKNKKVSIETRQKISNSTIGRFKGMSYEEIYGKKRAKKIRNKRSKQTSGTKNGMFGKNSWNKDKTWKDDNRIMHGKECNSWQGGKSFELYGIEFNKILKEKIRKRDNYRCQQCFRHQDELYDKKGKKYSLNIHHINYNKRNNSLNNLISLCRNCHTQTNYSRNDWTNYFKNKIMEAI